MTGADDFVSLHTHSQYSLLDGLSSVPEYCARAAEMGQRGIGISDHGNVSGVLELVREANKHGITPVPGEEFYMAPENPMGARNKEKTYYGKGGKKAPQYDVSADGAYLHQTIWAFNQQGVKNLFKLSSLSWKPDHYFKKPRIDIDMLVEHNEGLIVATGCPSSEISTRFLLGQDRKAYEYAGRLKEVFGNRLFVEVMEHGLKDPLERILLPKQRELSKKMGIPMLATNDSHYANRSDSTHHEHALCIQSGSRMSEKPFDEGGRRFAFSGDQFYLKSSAEMMKMFPEDDFPNAVKNSRLITEMAEGLDIPYDPTLEAKLDIPEGYTKESFFWELIRKGYRQKRARDTESVQQESKERIEKELRVITSEGFIDYFIVVWDYIKWARDNGVSVGVGRGSIGGSEIAYLLDISRTCPIRYGLMFERFLSEGRGATYEISYDDGTTEEIYVSNTKKTASGDEKYIHQLEPGDEVIIDSE